MSSLDRSSLIEKIILALDVEDIEEARYFIKLFSPYIKVFKIGPRLFIPYGKRIIDLVKSYKCEVFLDLKLHDIPSQVSASVEKIAQLGVKFLTIHSLGGKEMISSAVKSARKFKPSPKVLAVTILTSLAKNDLHYLNIKNKINKLVFKLTKLALENGVEGVVASVEDCKMLREKLGEGFLIVTPGVKFDKRAYQDQKRTATVRQAFIAGADYVVVGRALLKAKNPLKKLKEVTR